MKPSEQDKVLSVKDLNRYIRMKMDGDPRLSDVWIRGEISNFTHHSSGHMYFTLKDEGSRIKSIMFAAHNQKLPFMPKEGSKVIARGNVSVYERDGQYQFYASHMQPDGIGSLYLAFEQLKKKLEMEGLFASERKRPIPLFPATVGVVTSPTGAAVRDILITIRRRFPQVKVLLYPVLVQGKGAAASIVKGIKTMNRLNEADVLIVGRGGGSLEELWAFNEEPVARAIYESDIPVISAVGHETDFTIADFTADLRAATPTAAAEQAVPSRSEIKGKLLDRERQLQTGLQQRLRRSQEKLASLKRSTVLVYPRRYLLRHAERLDLLKVRLQGNLQSKARWSRERLVGLKQGLVRYNPKVQAEAAGKRRETAHRQLTAAMQSMMRSKLHHLQSEMRHLDALSPLKVMSRGYSLVYDEQEQKLIKSLGDVQPGDLIHVKVSDGRLQCQVWGMKEEKDIVE
ncbi:exodeoxyribonuclease VII large subunit [Paenibacillus lemnae]|uniref:Exodeoxyribonuclease 7 large subunit n=1 Tax=Paenibacillus lemnae TaxID=1330551 RepID=A0A848M7C5_PAELE|nr:exodeoxyribonuclease VII large subunit [Paenibacillus lemnae]NMO96887.1 exodeoxyribonuclease VII large subunit [Paenibacillus lemnae]